ncbi:RNA polymerase sigma factor [Actinosynnema sp. NPDC020468]|uniref:RNA polymerase sigma factor n=1 Tax=Actinosynnema sp. NPDC020468 TaxID=3154488 RepID=UPI0034010582
MTPTDAEIIERSRREPAAFAEIFDRHAPHIRRYLERRLGAHTADDLVADTFLTAFAKRDRYDRARPEARPWLYGIATRHVRRHHRQETRRYRTPPSEEITADHAGRVAHDLTARSTRSALTDALASLGRGERDVLLLIAWEQLTYGEVATALAIPVGTVRSRLSRARRKVRDALGADETTRAFEELLTDG